MFKEWGFLLAEIWVLLALAALLGLFAGWLIWGGRTDRPSGDELFRLQTQLDRERARTKAALAGPDNDIPPMEGGGYRRPSPPPVSFPTVDPAPVQTPREEPHPATTLTASSARPEGLAAPRDGIPDDLSKISGVGPKLAVLCNDLGFYHYDQIANWTADEIAWVDDNLEGFKGRVTRDKWVEQAKALAKNDLPTFLRRR
ncbi:NADH-quinone oxidoreductase subunit E [Pseudooctadecabacter sp.]|uniref:NADH-quinone oxidoreductase subunit E n=1 Tax=Pseudooctadecabacter sp. TaxID=1966338 RepID=UPI0025D14575|nr:NADH-quinone oxidoreductase subunit E [Pseudooctadecabacter sp.]